MKLTLTESGYEPNLREPKLPRLVSAFPLTKRVHRRLYRHRLEDHEVFRRLVESACSADSVVLDLGAGRGAPPAINLRGRVRHVVGLDVSTDIEGNPNLDEFHVADITDAPSLVPGRFDLVFARYVVEHLTDPRAVLEAVRRLLRPGGCFLFITPNRHHYVPALARSLGYTAHRRVNALRGRAPEDTFPTVYALNSVPDIKRLGADSGFSSVEVCSFESQPNYLTFHTVAFLSGVIYERIVNSTYYLTGLRGSIIAKLTA